MTRKTTKTTVSPRCPDLPKGVRLTGKLGELALDYAVARYHEGASIRTIAGELGRCYGTVHRLLSRVPNRVQMRPRGFVRRRKPA